MARSSLSASLVFSTKELKHFLRFQRQELRLKACEVGTLPSITEYVDYLTWRDTRRTKRRQSDFDPFALAEELSAHLNSPTIEKQNCGFLQPVAEVCKHPLHPGAIVQTTKCHVCTVKDHLLYLDTIEMELETAGEAQRKSPRSGGYYDEILSAWSAAKLSCVKLLCQVEESAAAELQWTMQHPDFVLVEETMSATMALEEYWEQFDYASAADLFNTGDHECARHVQFTEETNFDSGRIQCYFWQKSPRYEPGRYTMDPADIIKGVDEDDVDISPMTPRSEDFGEESEGSGSEDSTLYANDDTDQTSWDEEDPEERDAGAFCNTGFIIFGED